MEMRAFLVLYAKDVELVAAFGELGGTGVAVALTRAMRAAAPHADHLLAGNSLASLEAGGDPRGDVIGCG